MDGWAHEPRLDRREGAHLQAARPGRGPEHYSRLLVREAAGALAEGEARRRRRGDREEAARAPDPEARAGGREARAAGAPGARRGPRGSRARRPGAQGARAAAAAGPRQPDDGPRATA